MLLAIVDALSNKDMKDLAGQVRCCNKKYKDEQEKKDHRKDHAAVQTVQCLCLSDM
jgi:hypothetical protein